MSKHSTLPALHLETIEREIWFSQLSSRCLSVVFLDFVCICSCAVQRYCDNL